MNDLKQYIVAEQIGMQLQLGRLRRCLQPGSITRRVAVHSLLARLHCMSCFVKMLLHQGSAVVCAAAFFPSVAAGQRPDQTPVAMTGIAGWATLFATRRRLHMSGPTVEIACSALPG